MKKYIFILTILSAFFGAYSQDTVYFKSKDIKAVKVEEIGLNEIKYHSFDNLGGPMYVVPKSDITRIRYSNGKVDTFAVAAPKVENPTNFNTYKESTASASSNQIKIRKKKLYYEGARLGDKQLFGLVTKYPFEESKRLMMKDFNMAKVYKNKSYYGKGMMWAGILIQVIGGANASPVVFVGGAALGITGAVMSAVNKNRSAQKKVEIARRYNEWK